MWRFVSGAIVIIFAGSALVNLAFGDSSATEEFSLLGAKGDTAIIVRIESARIVDTPGGHECFFSYTSKITEPIRGSYSANEGFDFASDASLTVGERYFAHFLKRSVTTFRTVGPETMVNGKPYSYDAGHECSKRLNGPFLLYTELNLINYVDRGKTAVQAIEVPEAEKNFPYNVVTKENAAFVDLDFVRAQLNRQAN
jgi:hypothetical protein